MSVVLFTDIDDTLIQTERKHPGGSEPYVSAVDKEGKAASFSTPQQRLLLSLFEQHHIVPVTGRNKDALDRLVWRFDGFKVIDHGAIVIGHDDKIDQTWFELIEFDTQKWSQILNDYNKRINAYIIDQELNLRCRVISDYGIDCYLSIKGEAVELPRLSEISADFCALDDHARVHINDQNMALLPPYTCKKKAVEFVKNVYLDKGEETLFVGAGDSTTDLPFMSDCDFHLIPSSSQITRDKGL